MNYSNIIGGIILNSVDCQLSITQYLYTNMNNHFGYHISKEACELVIWWKMVNTHLVILLIKLLNLIFSNSD